MKRSEPSGRTNPTDANLGLHLNEPGSVKDFTPLLRIINKWLGGMIILLALFGLFNWLFQPAMLVGLAGFATMDPLSSLCFTCAACGLLALQSDRKQNRRWANFFAVACMAVAAFNFITALPDRQLLDSFFSAIDRTRSVNAPLNTFACFFLSGSGILLAERRTANDKAPSQYLALIIALSGLMSTMTYLYDVNDSGLVQYFQMTGTSGLCFMLVALGILFTRPYNGFMKEFTGAFIGSSIARVLLPVAIILPVLFGLIRIWSHRANLISTEGGVLFLVISIIVAFLSLITYKTRLLNKHDEEEQATATKLAVMNEDLERKVTERTSDVIKSERQFRTLIENSSDILSLVDENMQLIYRSPAAERILGWTMADRMESKGSISSTHPADLDYLNAVIKEIVRQPGKSLPVTFRTKHKLGHYLWVEGVVTNMLHDESVQAIVTNFKDITNEKIANDRFRLVVEGSPFGKILVNARGEMTLVNSRIESLFGYDRNELVGRNISTLIPADHWLKFVAHKTGDQKKNEKDPVAMGLEFYATRKNGSNFPVEIGLNPITSGEEVMILVSLQDITIRKITETKLALRSSELKETSADLELIVSRFKRAEQIASIGHWFFDLATQQTVWSDETFRLFGLRPQECEPNSDLFYKYVHPDDVEMVRAELAESQTNFSSLSLIHRIIVDGEREKYLYSVASYEFDEAGKAVRLYGVSMDVTALKKTEMKLMEYHQRHELLSKATNEAIWDWDVKRNMVLWNHGIESIFGYTNRKLESTESWWQARIHPDDVDRIVAQIQRSFDEHQNKLTLEYRYECADKSYKYVLDKAYVVYHDGEPVRVIGAMQDITELMQYRRGLEKMVEERTQELNAALEKEKELVAVKSKFVSIASHEFRTPLSTIALAAGFVKRHKSKLSGADIDRKLENIDKQVNHMTYLLDDILTIGKAEAGKMQVKMEEMDMSSIGKLAQEAIQSTGKKHKLVFSQQLKRETVVTDEKLVRNIIINLVTNAVKFSPDAEDVQVDVYNDDEVLTIRVKDEGIGIPDRDRPNLFNSFARGSNVSEIEGTGLGLSIVKKAVDMLNGKIEVKSEVGKGTEFKISIPV